MVLLWLACCSARMNTYRAIIIVPTAVGAPVIYEDEAARPAKRLLALPISGSGTIAPLHDFLGMSMQ